MRGEGAAAYVLVGLGALVLRLILAQLSVTYLNRGQEILWSWPMLGVVITAIGVGAAFAPYAHIPAPLDPRVSARGRFAWPALIGSAIAVLTIVSDVHSPAAAARGVATLHVPFPASLPFYAYGAIVLTVLFHFLPLALALALLRATALDRTWIPPAVVVVVLALSEDWNYLAQVGLRASVETARHVLSFAANLLELWFVQRFGLLAGLCQRLTTYAWWHVVWGALTK